MTPLDTWFLHVESDVDHMHIGSIGIFEGPPPAIDDVRAAYAAKLDLVPRYRQRVTSVPLGVARPVWLDDPHFSLLYHIRHTALPHPGGEEELNNLVGRVMGQQLDRRRSLWEVWIAEGLAGDRWALVSKVHHCMVDGVAGTDMLALILDDAPTTPDEIEMPHWVPEPTPSPLRLLREAALELATRPAEQVRVLRSVTRRPREVARQAWLGAQGAADLLGMAAPLPRSSLTGSLSPHRRWRGVRSPLNEVKEIREALGGTINDVVLAAVTSGYRDLLAKRDELTDDSAVRTLVPVSVRTDDERGDVHNRVSAAFVPLPVTVEDPVARFEAVRERTIAMKGSGEPLATAALVSLSGMAMPAMLGFGIRVATRLLGRGQRSVTTVTTNVPGPQSPLFLLGRRLLHTYPYVPIAEGLRTGVAIFSYAGELTFGVTGDYESNPDLDVLADGIQRGLAELLDAVR